MFENYIIDSWQKGVLYLITILVMGLLYFMAKKKVKFSYRVLTSLFIGIIVGLLLGNVKTTINGESDTIMATVRPIGQLYLRLIQMVVMPLVLTSIIRSFTNLDDTNLLKRIGLKTLFWLLLTTAIATIIGFTVAYIPSLGKGFILDTSSGNRDVPLIENVILDFFPNNIFSALTGNFAIPVVVFSIFVSVAIIVERKRHPERVEPFLKFNNSFNDIIVRITKFILRLTPYAVFSFITFAIGRNDIDALKQLGLYIVLIHVAMLIHFIFIQMGLLLINKISPIKFLKNFWPTMVVGFTTQSSYGTMPVNIKTLEERVGVSSKVANFVAPVGANVGMNACGGIFPAMVAVMTVNAQGGSFTILEAVLLVLITTIASIGIAGVPGIATIAAAVTLSALGLPIAGIALVAAVDPLIDMSRTMINVTGVGVSATLVAKSEKELDFDLFNKEKERAFQETNGDN